MNAIQILTKDHDKIKELFSQFEESGERAYKKRQTITEEVIKEIKTHSQLEERIFYPAVMEKGDKEIKKTILEGIEEHRVADYVMGLLQNTQPEDETFEAKFMVLIESVRHHLKEEEKELFPESRKILGKELDQLGQQMEALEKQLEG